MTGTERMFVCRKHPEIGHFAESGTLHREHYSCGQLAEYEPKKEGRDVQTLQDHPAFQGPEALKQVLKEGIEEDKKPRIGTIPKIYSKILKLNQAMKTAEGGYAKLSQEDKINSLLENYTHYLNETTLYTKELAAKHLKRYSHVQQAEYYFGLDYIKSKYHAASQEDQDDQFNCWLWAGSKWRKDSGKMILEDLEGLKIEDFDPEDKLASRIARTLSGDPDTLQVEKSEQYIIENNKFVYDQEGNYYNVETGRFDKVDPSVMFYEFPHVRRINPAAGEPKIWLEFLKNRFGDDWQIIDDQFAMAFIPSTKAIRKRKALYIHGRHNTHKSVLSEISRLIFHQKSMAELTSLEVSEKFAGARLMDRLISVSDEESPIAAQNTAILKGMITKSYGTVRQMFTTKDPIGMRYPVYIFLMNILTPIGKDDDDPSLFVRSQYVETLPADGKLWRKELYQQIELEAILLHWLKRASEIYNGAEPAMQEEKEAMKRYKEATTSEWERFFNRKLLKSDSIHGVSILYLWNAFKQFTGRTVSRTKFNELLADMGVETLRTRCSKDGDYPETYEIASEGPQRTLALGIKMAIPASGQQATLN